MRKLLNATALTAFITGTAGIAQTTDIQDVTASENGVNIEADAGTMPVDAETDGPGTKEQPQVTRTQIDPNPVNDQLETGFAPKDSDTAGGTMGATPETFRANARVADLIGLDVVNAGGEDIGRISDVVKIDTEIAAVIALGGFLNLGQKEVAVALDDLEFGDAKLTLAGVGRDDLEEMAAYEDEAGEALPGDAAVIVYE